MDYLSIIQQPVQAELTRFIDLFNQVLHYEDGLLADALHHVRQRGGKRLRPLMILLMAKNYGQISEATHRAAIGLELLHTASLVHDDVVDESDLRRGQASVNATYNNKVAVLVGDYILSTALMNVAMTHSEKIVLYLSELGRTLSAGEILQLTNVQNPDISEEVYFQIINQKTAALFESCAKIGAEASEADESEIEAAAEFGRNIGIIFQIRDDIFDYFPSKELGKPTGADMLEGKLTLPVLYALKSTKNEDMLSLARKVKSLNATPQDIARLIAFTIENGGIQYAEKAMEEYYQKCMSFINQHVKDAALKESLKCYADYVIQRTL